MFFHSYALQELLKPFTTGSMRVRKSGSTRCSGSEKGLTGHVSMTRILHVYRAQGGANPALPSLEGPIF